MDFIQHDLFANSTILKFYDQKSEYVAVQK